jgi:hypothetical protein
MATAIVTEGLLSKKAEGSHTANGHRNCDGQQGLVLPVVFFKFSQSDLSTDQCCKIRERGFCMQGKGGGGQNRYIQILSLIKGRGGRKYSKYMSAPGARA